jgi:hypothetical protein
VIATVLDPTIRFQSDYDVYPGCGEFCLGARQVKPFIIIIFVTVTHIMVGIDTTALSAMKH